MKDEILSIELYNKAERITTTMEVIQVSENVFRATENDLFIEDLTVGTEFETLINEVGKHELVRIVKKSEFITRQFLWPANINIYSYKNWGDEIMKHGGFWQIDFGSVVTINLPKDSALNLDVLFKEIGLNISEL